MGVWNNDNNGHGVICRAGAACGSAATPFGVAAMKALSDGSGTASDDMCMFVALNSSAIELLPTTVIAIRAACGAREPYDIVLPAFAASVISAAVVVISCKLLSKLNKKRMGERI